MNDCFLSTKKPFEFADSRIVKRQISEKIIHNTYIYDSTKILFADSLGLFINPSILKSDKWGINQIGEESTI